MKDYCRKLMSSKQKLQVRFEDISTSASEAKKSNHSHDYLKKEHDEDHKLLEQNNINLNLIVDSKEIEILSPIGQGSCSMVYKANYKELIVAVKKMTVTEEKPQQAMVFKI